MQFRQSETLRIFDHDDRGVGNVYTDFNDGRGYQDVCLPVLEILHDLFFLRALHLAVEHADPDFLRKYLLQLFRIIRYILRS